MKLLVRRFDQTADRQRFESGEAALDDWLRNQAGQAERKRLASVWIATAAEEPTTIVGYYSLAPWQVAFEECPPSILKRLPRYPIAVTLLARLAVARTAQGRGVGGELLVDALFRSYAASETIPVQAVLVHAKNARVADWYARHGFVPLPGRPLHLVMSMATISALPR